MRQPLSELRPEWIYGSRGGRVGLKFFCPEHYDHTISIYFTNPLDGEEPAQPTTPVLGPGFRAALLHTGDTFETLSLGSGLDHGEDQTIFIQNGSVIIG